MHWYKFDIGDYYVKAQNLTLLQHGCYRRLMDECYKREKFPTRKDAIDWLWPQSVEDEAAIDQVLDRMFEDPDENGIFYQNRIEETVERYQGQCETNSINGKKGGAVRKKQAKESKLLKNGGDSDGNGSDSDSSGSKKKANRKPKPVTSNQKPKTSNQCKYIIDYLNEVTGKNFKCSKTNFGHIKARAAEGHTVGEFKFVIENKSLEWLGDPKMEMFLRPATLFIPSKFEGYANEKPHTAGNYITGDTSDRKLSLVEQVRANAKKRRSDSASD